MQVPPSMSHFVCQSASVFLFSKLPELLTTLSCFYLGCLWLDFWSLIRTKANEKLLRSKIRFGQIDCNPHITVWKLCFRPMIMFFWIFWIQSYTSDQCYQYCLSKQSFCFVISLTINASKAEVRKKDLQNTNFR